MPAGYQMGTYCGLWGLVEGIYGDMKWTYQSILVQIQIRREAPTVDVPKLQPARITAQAQPTQKPRVALRKV